MSESESALEPLAGPPAASGGRRRGSAVAGLFAGALIGFIVGYFAGGGGRPDGSAPVPTSAASPDLTGRVEGLRTEIQRDPENPRLWTALGNTYYDREDWDHAIEAYTKALRKAPKDASVLSDLGAAYRNRGEFKRALASFEKSRAADPDHWQALLNIVLMNTFDTKNAQAAQAGFDELKRRYPDIPNIDKIQEQISRLRAS